MESPFGGPRKTTVMYLEPVLNTYYKNYQNVITLSNAPEGPLNNMVVLSRLPKLSEFQTMSPFYGNGSPAGLCAHVLLRYPVSTIGVSGSSIFSKNSDYAMTADDIPAVLSWLSENGYVVDTKMTRMLQDSEVNIGGVDERRLSGKRRMICFFTWNGAG